MFEPGGLRERLARILNAAFAEGLLSEQTLSYRLGLLFGPRLIEPRGVVGDLTLRRHRQRLGLASLASAAAAVRGGLWRLIGRDRSEVAPLVLALDWSGAQDDLLIGRGSGCDIALRNCTVSRRHARLIFRDGGWIIQDLESMNGITVNGVLAGRCRLQPGDRLGFGLQLVDVD
ncbi:MAG: FHA domain-containing protein [Solirubrobacterales bacterium]